MQKYLVVYYYSWEGDFALSNAEIFDTEAQAKQRQQELLQDEIWVWMLDGTRILFGAEQIDGEILDRLPEGTIIIENYGNSIIISEYGRSSINHGEIIIKQIEI